MRKTLNAVLASVVFLWAVPVNASVSTTAGDATPNFTESAGCGVFGITGPLSPTLQIGAYIYGPFADFFGRSYGQVSGSIVDWTEPSGKLYRVHARIAPVLGEVSASILESGEAYSVTSGAAWVWRNIGGKYAMSHHAVGSALDINPSSNPYSSTGVLITDLPPAYVDAWVSAGFCWGGAWMDQKDPMHFSWRGPASSAGLVQRLAPYPPLTGAASFTVNAFDGLTEVPSDGLDLLHAMADRTGDGADDIYQLRNVEGSVGIIVSSSRNRFLSVGVVRETAASVVDHMTLADSDGDGKADLWTFSDDGGTVSADLYTDSSGFSELIESYETTIPWSDDIELGMALFDWADYRPDLFVLRRATNSVEVYSASSGFSDRILQSTVPFDLADHHLMLADRDVDGNPDLWVVSTGSAASVRIVNYRPATGYSGTPETLTSGMSIGESDDVLPGDWDGDGRVDVYRVRDGRITVWLGGVPDRPIDELGNWFTPQGEIPFDNGPECQGLCDSVGGVDLGAQWRLSDSFSWSAGFSTFYYGRAGDAPFMGDWDCDGVDTPGLYRRSDGFVYLRDSNDSGWADHEYYFGRSGDLPVAGDFNGDGCDTVSVYRPSEGKFYIINSLEGGWAEREFEFGRLGDTPFAGDFDGDGVDSVGLHRPTTGLVYFRNELSGGWADEEFVFGRPGDYMFAGDWDGDGDDTVGLFRPSDARWYILLTNRGGTADHVLSYGAPTLRLKPVVGYFGIATD